MKRIFSLSFSLAVVALLASPQLFADAGQQLIPAGSLVSCTTGDARISSRTTAVGDPVLCKVEHRRGDFMLPYGSYLGGEFSEYKDPGHFIGKGWMELEFDRLYVGGTVVPIDAKVVDVPGYKIDAQGRILGKGHPVRDTITWMIPVLWPIDLINLPRRGPRPTLKSETALTLRVMEDIEVPVVPEPQRDPYGLIPRGDSGYAPEPPPPADNQQAQPEMSYAPNSYGPDPYGPDPYGPSQDQQPAPEPPPAVAYAAPVPYPPMYAPAMVAPPVVAYGGFYVGPRVSYGVGVYAARSYAGYGVRGYAGARPYAGVSPYAAGRQYGYGGRGYAGGYAGRSYAMYRGGGFRGGYGRR